MEESEEFEYTIPSQYIYEGIVMQGELFPREGVERARSQDFLAPNDVLVSSSMKTGKQNSIHVSLLCEWGESSRNPYLNCTKNFLDNVITSRGRLYHIYWS